MRKKNKSKKAVKKKKSSKVSKIKQQELKSPTDKILEDNDKTTEEILAEAYI